MNKEDSIKKAREFAKRSLTGKMGNVNQEDYYMFLISKFLLLKEMIIKKNSKEDILYFDYNRNKDYLPAIKYIVDYIKLNGKVEKNETKVDIKPEEYNSSSLQFYIWTINKLRDSLAHGMYEFDLENERLIIKNDHSKDRNAYVLNCKLPIEILEFFTYIAKKTNFKYDEQEIEEFKKYSKEMRNNFGYSYDYDDDKIENNITSYNNDNILNIKYYNDNLNDIKSKKMYEFDSEIIDNNSYKYLNQKKEILKSLLLILKNSDLLSETEKELLYTYLINLGLFDKDFKRLRRNKKTNKEYAKKLTTVISEISSILGIKSNSNEGITFAAIYNYMQLTFSLNNFKFKSKEEKELLGYLKISKLNPIYVKTNNKKLNLNIDSEYSKKLKSIQSITEKFITQIKEKIMQYKNNPNSLFRQSINYLFKKYYEDIISSFADKNSFVLTSIRNSIEHANIHDVNGVIMLNDQGNQIDYNTVNFVCYGNPNDFYEITNSLETRSSKEKFTFDDFIEELKPIIDSTSLNDLLLIIKELKTINEEALVNILKNSIYK